jgi:hypothetical protein
MMAYYAFLNETNFVTQVIVGKDEGNMDWEAFYSFQTGQSCKRTSYNTHGGIHYDPVTNQPSEDQSKSFRKNYAGVGYFYDVTLDAFIPPKPYASWVLNTQTCLWEAPVPYPNDGEKYDWDESTQNWVLE